MLFFPGTVVDNPIQALTSPRFPGGLVAAVMDQALPGGWMGLGGSKII